jgi:predicted anti-sigma-YlaC factor YlaD
LLLAAASGFTQYGYAYVECDADYVEARDLQAATALRQRARRLYRRALGYGLRGLEVGHPGLPEALRRDPVAALAGVGKNDVPLLYWTASAWGALISLTKEDGEVTADLPLAVALMERARALDDAFADGAVEDFFIAYEGGRPAAAGGSPERARAALDTALDLASGRRAAPLVSYAETVSVATQNRTEFNALLARALAVDPDSSPENRLANLIAQRRARWLLGRADELFLE